MSKPSQKKQLKQRRRGKAVRRSFNIQRNNEPKDKDAEPSPATQEAPGAQNKRDE